MKKVRLVCVGKIKEKFIADGVEHYAKRLKRFCDFSVEEVPDYPDDENAVAKESALLIKKLGGFVILFDLGGEIITSEKFSAIFENAYARGDDTVSLVIGGSRGVSDDIKRIADKRIAFGKVTYPHRLMRLIAAEQIYRAFTISANLPYHK